MTSKETANGETLARVNPVSSTKRSVKINGVTFVETNYEGYFVSNDGVVISFRSKNGRGTIDINKPPKFLKYGLCGGGRKYYSVICSLGTKKIPKTVHKLVYETFKGDVPSDMTIDHIDGNTFNNNVDNLQLLSAAENTRKANTGRVSSGRKSVHLILDGKEYSFKRVLDMQTIIPYNLVLRGRYKLFDCPNTKYRILSFSEDVTTIEIEVQTLRE